MAAYREDELLSAGDISASEDIDTDDEKKKKKLGGEVKDTSSTDTVNLMLDEIFIDDTTETPQDTPSIERPSKIQEEPVAEEEVVETQDTLPPMGGEVPIYEEPQQNIQQVEWDAGKQILTPDEEQQFQQYMQTEPSVTAWQEQVVEETGAPPDIDTGDYDYRAAWKAGVKPEATNEPLEKTSEYAIKWTTPEADGRQLMSPSNPNRYRINPQVTLPPYAQMPDPLMQGAPVQDQIAEDELQRVDTQGLVIPSLRQKVGDTDYDAAQRQAQMAGLNYQWDDATSQDGKNTGETKIPNWIKAGVNQSMIGMGKQMIDSGEPIYDLSNVELSTLEEVGATVLALGVMDLPFFMATGGAGAWAVRGGAKLAVRGMQKRAVAQLVKNGAKEQVAERAVAMAIKNNPKIVNGLAATVSGMTGFGPYSGSMSYMGEKISAGQTGSFDPEGSTGVSKTFSLVPEFMQAANDVLSQDLPADARRRVTKESVIGTVLGGSLGILSYGTGLVKGEAINAAQRLEIGAAGFISEVFLFTAGDSYLRGESVTWEKFEHAAFTVGGLKVGGGFRGAIMKGKAPFAEDARDIGEVSKIGLKKVGVDVDKILEKTEITIELTPEELESLLTAGSFTPETAAEIGYFTTEAAGDYLKGLSGPERSKLIKNKKIPVTLKEKIVEIVTGKRPEFLQKISGVKTTENSDGTGSVTILNERGEVLQIEQFSSSSRAKDVGTRIWQNIETAKKFADLAGLPIEKRGALENKMSARNLVSSKVSEAMITLPEFRSADQKKLVAQFDEISEQFVEREAKKVAEAEAKEPTEEVTEKVTEEVAPKEDVVEKVDVEKPAPTGKAAVPKDAADLPRDIIDVYSEGGVQDLQKEFPDIDTDAVAPILDNLFAEYDAGEKSGEGVRYEVLKSIKKEAEKIGYTFEIQISDGRSSPFFYFRKKDIPINQIELRKERDLRESERKNEERKKKNIKEAEKLTSESRILEGELRSKIIKGEGGKFKKDDLKVFEDEAKLSDKEFFKKVFERQLRATELSFGKTGVTRQQLTNEIAPLENILYSDRKDIVDFYEKYPLVMYSRMRELQALYSILANREVVMHYENIDIDNPKEYQRLSPMYDRLEKARMVWDKRKVDAATREDYERAEIYRKLSDTIKKGIDKAFNAVLFKKDLNKILKKLDIEPIKGQVVGDKDVLYQKQDTELDKYWGGLLRGQPESQRRVTVRNYSSAGAEAARLRAIDMLGEKNVGEIQQTRDMRGQSEFIFSATKPEVAPTPEAEPTLKGMVPYENIRSKKDLAVALEDIFNISKEKAQADAEIFDSVAETWASKRPGKTKEDWYKEKIAQIRQGLIGGEEILYQEVGPGLDIYETATKALAKIKQNKATSQQWKSMLLKNGAKKSEMDFIGLTDFLLDNPKLTKEQISEFLSENKLEVIEVLKSGTPNKDKRELDKTVGEIEELTATEIPNLLEELDAEYPYTPFSDVASTIADSFDKTQVLTSDPLPGEKAFKIDFVKRAITAEDKALRVREMEKLSKNLGYENIDDFIKDSMISYLENKKARSEEAFDTANRLGYLQEVKNEGAKEIALVDYIRSLLPKDYKIKLERRPVVHDGGAKLISNIKSSLRTTYNEEKVTSADQLLGKGKVFSPEFREDVLRELDKALRRSSLATQQNWEINTFVNDNKPPTKDMFKVPEADDMEAMGAKLNLAGKELAPYEKYIDWSEKGEDGKPGVFKYLSSVGTKDKIGMEREMGLSSTSELVIDAFEKLKKAQETKRELRKKIGEDNLGEDARFGAYSLAGGKKYREMLFLTPRPKQKSVPNVHWTEDNVMAHMRWDERSDIERNRVMHIGEIQSDWMNRGKAGGFKLTTEENRERTLIIRESEKEIERIIYNEALYAKGKKLEEVQKRLSDLRELVSNLRESTMSDGDTPRLAFHKDWYVVVLQRAIKYAADNGFDRVTWDEGITEAIRSGGGRDDNPILTRVKVMLGDDGNLSVSYKKADRETGVTEPDDMELLGFDKETQSAEPRTSMVFKDTPELEKTFGKKAVKQIINELRSQAAKRGEWITVELDEPTMIGWETRRNFYDVILPSAAKKIGKKFNSRTGKTEVLTGTKRGRESMGRGFWFKHKEGTAPAHYIDITPQVKEYYSSSKLLRQDKKAAITFDKEGKAIISALTNPNFVSPLHELVHMFDSDLNIRDAQNVLDWAKEKTWNINTRERFARAFELYLEEGKAPNAKLKSVFEKFKTWLKDVYKGVIRYLGKDVKLTDTIRDIFDRVLTPEEKGRISEKIEDVVEGFGGLKRFAQKGEKGPLFQDGGKKLTAFQLKKAMIKTVAERAERVAKESGIRDKKDLIEALKKEYPGNSNVNKGMRIFIDTNQDVIIKKMGKVSVDIPEKKVTEEEARTINFLRTLDAFEYGVPIEDIKAGKLEVNLPSFKAARTFKAKKAKAKSEKLQSEFDKLQKEAGLPIKEIDAIKNKKAKDRTAAEKKKLNQYSNFVDRKRPKEIRREIREQQNIIINENSSSVKQSLKDTFNNKVSKAIETMESQIAKGEDVNLDMLSANRIAKAVMAVVGDINYAIDSAASFLKGLDKNRNDKKVTPAKLKDIVLEELGFDKEKDRLRQALGIEDKNRSEIGELFDMLDNELGNVPKGTDLGNIKTRIIEFASKKSVEFKATNLRKKELASLISKLKKAKTPDSLRESMEDLKELMKKIAARNIYQNLDKLHAKAKKNYKKNKFLDSSGFQNDVREFLLLKASDIPTEMLFNYMDVLSELSVSDRLPVTTASKVQNFNLATAAVREKKLQEMALDALEAAEAKEGKESETQEKLKAVLKEEADIKITNLDVDKSMLSKMGRDIYDDIKSITFDEMKELSTGQLKVLNNGLTLLGQGRLAPKLVTDVLDKVIIPNRIAKDAKKGMAGYIKDEAGISKTFASDIFDYFNGLAEPTIENKEKLASTLSRLSPDLLDKYFRNANGALFSSIYKPLEAAHNEVQQFTDKEGSEIRIAYRDLASPLIRKMGKISPRVFGGLKSRTRSNIKIDMLMKQIEFEAEGGEGNVFRKIFGEEGGDTGLAISKYRGSEAEALLLKDVYEKLPRKNGDVDWKTVESSLSKGEKKLIGILRNIFDNELLEKAIDANLYGRGEPLKRISMYSPRRRMETGDAGKQATGEEQLKEILGEASYETPVKSTKASATYERKKGEETPSRWLDIDAISNAHRAIFQINRDYFLGRVIKQTFNALDILEKGSGKDTAEQRIYSQLKESLRATLKGEFSVSGTLGERRLSQLIKTRARHIALARPLRPIIEAGTNLTRIVTHPEISNMEALKALGELTDKNKRTEFNAILAEIKSPVLRRIGTYTGETDASKIESGLQYIKEQGVKPTTRKVLPVLEGSGTKTRLAKGAGQEIKERVLDFMQLSTMNQLGEAVNSTIIRAGDAHTVRMAWLGALKTEYKKQTGKDVTIDTFKNEMKNNPTAMKQAVDVAERVAAETHIGSSPLSQPTIMKRGTEVGKGKWGKSDTFKELNYFLGSFGLHESMRFSVLLRDFVKGGSKSSRAESAWQMGGMIGGNMFYLFGTQILLNAALVGVLKFFGKEESEWSKDYSKRLSKQIESGEYWVKNFSMATLQLLIGKYGTVYRYPLAIIAEHMNKLRYEKGLTFDKNKEYDEFLNAIAYKANAEDLSDIDMMRFAGAINVVADGLEYKRITEIISKVSKGEKLRADDQERYLRLVVLRAVMNATLSAPISGELNRAFKKGISKAKGSYTTGSSKSIMNSFGFGSSSKERGTNRGGQDRSVKRGTGR